MLGTLRLILAVLVALSHANLRVAGLNPGVIAVIGFYLISGYVMAGLIRRHYAQPQGAPAFYLDRAIRLLPQYLFYIFLTLAWHLYSRADNYFLSRIPGPLDLLNNLLVVPLNYYMFNGSDRYTLIPPAWSLGAEVQFYLLAPFVLLWPKRLFVVGLLGLVFYGAALAGLINSDWFGYRLLPGVLLFFLLGAYLQQLHHQPEHVGNGLDRQRVGQLGKQHRRRQQQQRHRRRLQHQVAGSNQAAERRAARGRPVRFSTRRRFRTPARPRPV